MFCILCLKPNECPLFVLSTDEAISLDVKGILAQHFWFKPKENDIVCKECWSSVFDFHKFYLRVKLAYENQCQETKVFDYQVLCELEELKVEENSQLHEKCSGASDDSNALEDPIGNTEATNDDFSLEEYKIEENNEQLESSTEFKDSNDALKDPIDDIIVDALSKSDEHSRRRASRHKEESNQKTDKELLVLKKRRGRPPKRSDVKTKKVKVSTELVSEQPDSADHVDLIANSAQVEKNQEKKPKAIKTEKPRRDLTQYDDFIAENMKMICNICKEDCESFRNIQIHFRKKHKTRGYVVCCGLKLLKRGVLLDHLQTHKDPEYFKCTKCDKVLANRRSLNLHQKNHHQEKGEPKFKCEICSKAFHIRRVLQVHMERHVPEELRKFQCEHCPKRYTSEYLLNNHVKRLHLKVYTRICDVCGKKIIGSEAFRTHQEQHKGNIKVIVCGICGAKVKSKYDLTRHKKEQHTAEFQTPQKCNYCAKISPNLMALKRHIKYMHRLERSHKCSMCEKSFKRAVDLKEHFQTHTNDVGGLYICSFCPRTFNSSANMYNHRKRMHPEEWAQHRKDKEAKLNTGMNLETELNTLLE